MRRYSANYIFPVGGSAIKNGIVEIEDSGKIHKIIDTKGELRESRNLEFYNGVIVPGFVNSHCHLELSELKNKIEQRKSLPRFLENIVKYKQEPSAQSNIKTIELANDLMKKNGIVAVGDISNTNITKGIKENSTIYYHTFIEAIGLGDNHKQVFEKNKNLHKEFKLKNLQASIVPHAPYSVSKELFLRIKKQAESEKSILSIHNQESDSENQMFINKSGELVKALINIGVNLQDWNPTEKTSLESIIDWLPLKNNVLFVHNTFSKKSDIELVQNKLENAYWCLCPLSNLFIENKLPDINLFQNLNNNVIFGTDSFASNMTLSILEEMKVIANNFKTIPFENMIRWATLNGAKALKIDDRIGSIEEGKTPGLNLITNFDFEKMNITKKSDIKVLA